MMKRLLLTFVLALCCIAAPLSAFALPAGSTGITNRYSMLEGEQDTQTGNGDVVVGTHVSALTGVNRSLDGAVVRFSGEAIGDLISDGDDRVWVNVLGDDGSSIGVNMTREQAEVIKNYGNYKTKGSTLSITGLYSIACSDHQGELDVHAQQVVLVDGGGSVTHNFSENNAIVGLVLCVVGLSLLLVFLLLRKRHERRSEDD